MVIFFIFGMGNRVEFLELSSQLIQGVFSSLLRWLSMDEWWEWANFYSLVYRFRVAGGNIGLFAELAGRFSSMYVYCGWVWKSWITWIVVFPAVSRCTRLYKYLSQYTCSGRHVTKAAKNQRIISLWKRQESPRISLGESDKFISRGGHNNQHFFEEKTIFNISQL